MLAALPLAAPAAAGPEELLRLLFVLAIMLAAGKFSGELFDRAGQPAVLGELLAGAVLGGSALGIIPTSPDDPLYGTLHVLAEIGVIVLLFEIGLETDLKQLLRVGPGAASVAAVGVALPFAAGFLYWISPLGVEAFNTASASTTAIFLGAALTATSVGITARVLTDLKIFRTTEAQTILGAAVLDDVLGLVLLGLVASLAAGGSVGVLEVGRALGVALGFLAVALGLGLLLAPRIFATIDRMRVRGVLLVSAFAFVLVVSALAQVAGSAMIIGAFAAVLLVGGVVTLIAGLGKVAAGWAAPWRRFNRLAVGVGMMPRGEVGLIFANIGLSQGILSRQLFGAIMIMVIATTFLAPPLLKWSVRRGGVPPAEDRAAPPWHPVA